MRILVFLIIVFSVLLSGAAANAQAPGRDDVLKSIEQCRAISVDFMRAACLDAGNRFLADDTAIITSAPSAIAPPPTPPSPSTSLQSPEAEVQTARAALAKERAEIEQARAELDAKVQTQSANERLGLLSRLGLARNVEQDDENLAATITIERVTYNRKKIHRFYTSDGDIIVQDARSLRMRLPDTFPATATLEKRTLGSKWLTFTDIPGRTYRVKIIDQAGSLRFGH
jgi:hypothetical protein